MNINFTRILSKLFLVAPLLVFLFGSALKAQESTSSVEKIQIDLTDISGLSARIQFYDYLRQVSPDLIEPQPGIIEIEAKSTQADAMRTSYFKALDSIQELEKQRDKFTSSDIMINLSEFYGENLLNKVMGRDDVSDSCHKSFPFCTSNIYDFPAGVGTGNGQTGPNYGCLKSTPNPAWYHMRILEAGDITIKMVGTRTNGGTLDIDFALWGPYIDPVSPCSNGLTANCSGNGCPNNTSNPNFYPSGNLHDCSYSSNSIEYAHIDNGQVGQYYILLITNYADVAGNITFQKTGGTGQTDCTILPPPISSNSPVCYGDDLFLTADSYPGATYSWTGPNGFTSNQQSPVINNPGLAYSGTYTLEITVDNITSEPIDMEVVIAPLSNPDFTFEEVCYGNPNQFTSTSTVSPDGSAITAYNWNFGDGSTSNLQNPSHIYSSPGSYMVKLSTSTDMGYCTRSITQTVEVPEYPYADAGDDKEIPNGWTVDLVGDASGGTGNLSYLWEPQNLVNNPTALITSTVSMSQTTVFTLTVTDNISGCVTVDEMIVTVTGGALFVQAAASPGIICLGESTQLNATPSGGAGDYTYSWSSSPAGFSSNIRNPLVSPTETTTYTVAVFDGQVTVNSTVTVEIKPVPVANAGADQTINVGTAIALNGSASGGSGSYNYNWSPADSLENPGDNTLQNPMTKLLNVPTTYQLTILDNNGCSSPADATTVFTAGDFLAVYAQASKEVICLNESTQLSATALGGSGDYTYSWTANNSGWTSNEQNPPVSPETTAVYTVQADDGFKVVSSSVEVTVNSLPVVEIKPASIPWFPDPNIPNGNINVCVRDSVLLDAGPNMNYLWSNGSSARKVLVKTNGNWIDVQTWDVLVTNPVTGCKNTDELTILFDFNACNIGLDELNNVSDLMALSPNPARAEVKLKAKKITADATLFMFSNTGKQLLQKAIPANRQHGIELTIPTDQYSSGTYYIVLTTAHSFAVKTLIIH